MRRISFAILIGLALALASVAPAFAGDDKDKDPDKDSRINVWCSVDSGTQVDITGNYVVSPGSHGTVVLWLFGSNNGTSWHNTGLSKTIHVVQGQTSYGFNFNAHLDSSHYLDYRVQSGETHSRVINQDECGFRVPEAPSSSLLLLGAFPAAALIAIKARGIRFALPTRNRIA